MSIVLKLFREEIAGVDFARYVRNFNCLVLHVFTDGGFVEVEMLGSFVGEGGRPVDGGFVVVEDCRAVVSFNVKRWFIGECFGEMKDIRTMLWGCLVRTFKRVVSGAPTPSRFLIASLLNRR